jgi:hypothetical protein
VDRGSVPSGAGPREAGARSAWWSCARRRTPLGGCAYGQAGLVPSRRVATSGRTECSAASKPGSSGRAPRSLARRGRRSSERRAHLHRERRPSGRSTRREAETALSRRSGSGSGRCLGAFRFWVEGGVRSRSWAGDVGLRIPASCPGSRRFDRTLVRSEASASDRLEGWSQGGKPHRGRCVLGFRARV